MAISLHFCTIQCCFKYELFFINPTQKKTTTSLTYLFPFLTIYFDSYTLKTVPCHNIYFYSNFAQ
jgi:hypothetical protein